MIAFKPLQESSAFRLWCKANDMELSEYNEVAKNLESFVEDKKWGKIIEDSKAFRGVIESVSPSPCSFLLLDKPISEEVGLIKVGNEMCCCLDGYQCDQWKFLKNDYLTVKVYKLISETYKEIGRPIDTISQLVNNADKEVWKLYKDGITTTLNQADSDFATPIVKKYSPTSLAELSAWVSAIRPGFASLLSDFIERKGHTTGIKELDELLKDSYSYMLYQESIMKFLVWLDVPEKDTYDIIKKISKKKFKENELIELKEKLKKSWIKKTGSELGFEENWKVVEDAVRYSFNASHALSVGIDSLYGAYLKSKHSLEYMTTAFNLYDDDIERTAKLVKELDYFNIGLISPKFGYSKGKYFYDKKSNNIYKGIASMKNLNEKVGDELYLLSQEQNHNNFLDLLIDIKEKTSCNSRQLEILVRLDYFDIFGKSKKLLNFIKYFDLLYNKKAPKKKTISEKITDTNMIKFIEVNSKPTDATYTKFDYYKCLNEIFSNIREEEIDFIEKITFEKDIVGSINFTNKNLDKRFVLITSIKDNGKYTPIVDTYCLNNGKTCKCKINKKTFKDKPLGENDMIYINSMEKRFGYKIVGQKENGKPIFETDHNKIEWWITSYNRDIEENEILV